MNLSNRILKGGMYLIGRQSIGLIINFIGVILLAKVIGPVNYGIYITAQGLILFMVNLGKLGADVYLVRLEEFKPKIFNHVYSTILISSIVLLVLGYSLSGIIVDWIKDPRILLPFKILLFTLPFTLLTNIFMIQLEKELEYKVIARTELIGSIIFYTSSISVGLFISTQWSAVVGYILWQGYNFLTIRKNIKYVPRIYWSNIIFKDMLEFGMGYNLSTWIWQIRSLSNPLIVSKYLGVEYVAIISMTIKFLDTLSFAKNAIWRLSLPSLAKLQNEKEKLKKAIEEGMLLQLISVGPFIVAFSIIGELIVRYIYGESWNGVMKLYPYLAIPYIFSSIFNLHTAALYVFKENAKV